MQLEMNQLKQQLLKTNTESTDGQSPASGEARLRSRCPTDGDDDFDIDDLKAVAEKPKIIAKSTAQDKLKKYKNVDVKKK